MDAILTEIETALKAKLYYLALSLALTIPDICSALESPDGKTSRNKYKAWFETNLASAHKFFTADACYELRCGVLHEGTFSRAGESYSRVIFTLPGTGFVDGGFLKDALQLDLVKFCERIIAAARSWEKDFEADSTVQNNLERLVQYRPNGLAPYIVGLPMIA